MTARMKKRPLRGAAAVIPEGPATSSAGAPIVERPDGYYWIAADGRKEFGPFDSIEAARADRDSGDEGAPAPGETLQEAELEIGIADWIDPETGAPAEGHSPPHLENDEGRAAAWGRIRAAGPGGEQCSRQTPPRSREPGHP